MTCCTGAPTGPKAESDQNMRQSPEPAVTERWIYHFTHVDNLPAILAADCLRCDASARLGMMRTEVGAADIKESRRRRTIPIAPGGRVGDYVPFYFAPRSPMMYRIACEHRDRAPDRYQGGDKPLVYLISTVGTVTGSGAVWVATDGNAATATTEFTSDLGDLAQMVDWPLLEAER
jgi:ssDNA thymidine ADP-ribosyltransferase, DarT